MLRFELIFPDESRVALTRVLSAKLDCQLSVPADSLTLTLPFEKRLHSAAYAAAWDGEALRFYGQIDEVITVNQSGKHFLRLCARSLAAFLLDNEAQPLTYENPSHSLIAARHLLPFGVTEFEDERQPLYNSIQIHKGMSHWQVFERYCRLRYGEAPRIEGRKAYFKGYRREGTAVFGENGMRIISLRERRRPCRLISEIRMRLSNEKGYSSVIRNNNPGCAGVTRVRYLNGLADNVSLDTAAQVLEKSNRDAYLLTLVCSGTHAGLLGMAAVVEDSGLGRIEGLRVTGVCCERNEKGELTTVSLRKEQF